MKERQITLSKISHRIFTGRSLAEYLNRPSPISPYLVFAPSDAVQMLQIWHAREPEKQMQWLKERLQNKPEEADSFLEIFSGSEQDYQKIQKLIDPKFLSGILTEQSRSIPPGRSTDWFLSRQKLAAQA
jgi:hypothetical protein